MKQQIQNLLSDSLQTLSSLKYIPELDQTPIQIEYSRDPAHGNFASNIALVLAKKNNLNPRETASKIIKYLPKSRILEKTELAGPGFINFFVKPSAYHSVITDILHQKVHYGDSNIGNAIPVLIEFISANPTGPLHIGHGRGAAYGAAVSNLLMKVGFKVSCEYYINDAGRQIDILTVSVWLRYLQKCNQAVSFPSNAYKGNYIYDIADALLCSNGQRFLKGIDGLSFIFSQEDTEETLDKLIKYCKQTLGNKDYLIISDISLDLILQGIKKDLVNFGIEYDNWFSERSLINSNKIAKCIDKLTENGWVYEKNGAKWFSSSKLGDEKDRVLIRDNGHPTYFASDIAYHISKLERGFKKIINIWGADHHGYMTRLKASIEAMGFSADKLEILLVQFATLYRGKEKLQMSTRSGEFITLKELQHEVGKDACRFFYIMRKSEQHLNFDLELAKSESKNNPVFYIQYTHARISRVFRRLIEKGLTYDENVALSNLLILTEPPEIKLLSSLNKYPEIIENAAVTYEPHQLAYYLTDLSNHFHSYYDCETTPFLVIDSKIRNARLALIDATKQVIKNGLNLLGVDAPEVM